MKEINAAKRKLNRFDTNFIIVDLLPTSGGGARMPPPCDLHELAAALWVN